MRGMGQVIKFQARKAPTAKKQEPYYFCVRCDTDRFKILADRTIHCASCGARMRNLFASSYGPAA